MELILQERGVDRSERSSRTYKAILLLLYDIIKDSDKKTEFKNLRIICMKAYMELFHLKNKFLCYSSITRLGQLNLSFLSKVKMLVDS